MTWEAPAYEPVFEGWERAGWRSRWRMVREFVERWYGRPIGDIGNNQDGVDYYADIAGQYGRLPPSLNEYVALWYEVCVGLYGSESSMEFTNVEEYVGAPAVSLVMFSEGGSEYYADARVWWAVRVSDFDSPDPPVTAFSRSGGSRSKWAARDFARTVSDAAAAYLTIHDAPESRPMASGRYPGGGRLRDGLDRALPQCTRFGLHGSAPGSRAGRRLRVVHEGRGVIALTGPAAERRGPADVTLVAHRPVDPQELPPELVGLAEECGVHLSVLSQDPVPPSIPRGPR